jgi:hypothetical protein
VGDVVESKNPPRGEVMHFGLSLLFELESAVAKAPERRNIMICAL